MLPPPSSRKPSESPSPEVHICDMKITFIYDDFLIYW